MRYERMETGRFLERPNRFIAYVEIAGQKEIVHVKNTGSTEIIPLQSTTRQPEKTAGWSNFREIGNLPNGRQTTARWSANVPREKIPRCMSSTPEPAKHGCFCKHLRASLTHPGRPAQKNNM